MNPLSSVFSADLLNRLGWTLLHSLWLLAVIGVFLWVMLRALGRQSSNLRYLTTCLGLAAMVVACVVAFALLPGRSDSVVLSDLESNKDLLAGDDPVVVPVQARPPELTERAALAVPTPVERQLAVSRHDESLLAWLTATFSPWLPGIVVAWFGGIALLSLWNLAGWMGVQRIRRIGAKPASNAWLRAAHKLIMRMKIRQAVQIAESTLVNVPIVVGWLKPMVLLPTSLLGEMSPSQIEAILAHELAHIRRHDYAINLFQTIIETLLFFHPAVWWISRQIRIEREHCCDDLAVRVCGDRIGLSEALTIVAASRLAPQPALAISGSRAGGALYRVQRLLSPKAESLDSSKRLAACVVLSMLSLVLFFGWNHLASAEGRANAASAEPREATADPAADSTNTEQTVATPPDKASTPKRGGDSVIPIRGQVVDPDGNPVAGAVVRLPVMPSNEGRSVRSDENGRFTIELDKKQYTQPPWHQEPWKLAILMATAKGFAPVWKNGNELATADEVTLQLRRDDAPLRGQVLDLEGQPVPHAKLLIDYIYEPLAGNLDKLLETVRDTPSRVQMYQNHEMQSIRSSLFKLELRRGKLEREETGTPLIMADEDGRFECLGIGNERLVRLSIAGPHIESARINVITRNEIADEWVRKPGSVEVQQMMNSGGPVPRVYPASFKHLAGPSAPISGVIRDKATGRPIAGIHVSGWLRNTENSASATTDEIGRYELEGLAVQGTFQQLYAGPLEDKVEQLPYLGAQKARTSFSPSNPLKPTDTNFELTRGILVRGKVTDAATNAPGKVRVEYLAIGENPHRSGLTDPLWPYGSATTDESGQYVLVVPPGPGTIAATSNLAIGVADRYRPANPEDFGATVNSRGMIATANGGLISTQTYKAAKPINFDADHEPAPINFALRPIIDTVRIRCVDDQGQPVRNVSVLGHLPTGRTYPAFAHGGLEIGRGLAAFIEVADLEAESRLPVVFYDNDNRRAAILYPSRASKTPRLAELKRDADGAYRIELRPTGTITGRLIDGKGEPISGASLELQLATGEKANEGRARISAQPVKPDGRFEIRRVPTGGTYVLGGGAPGDGRSLKTDLRVEAEQTLDLGDIEVSSVDVADEVSKNAENKNAALADKSRNTTAPMPAKSEEQITVRGRVVDESGKPVANVTVTAARFRNESGNFNYGWESDRQEMARIKSGLNGRFALTFPKWPHDNSQEALSPERWQRQRIEASADGYGPAFVDARTLDADKELSVTMATDDVPITGRVLDLEGQPVPNVRIAVQSLWDASGADAIDRWRETLAAYVAPSAATERPRTHYFPFGFYIRSSSPNLAKPVVTDAMGRFRMTGLGRDRLAILELRSPTTALHLVQVVTRRMEAIEGRRLDEPGLRDGKYFGADCTLVVEPSQLITGVVRDADSGRPIPGAVVTAYVLANTNQIIEGLISAVADEAGRYQLSGLPRGNGHLLSVYPPSDAPYFTLNDVKVDTGDGLGPVEQNIELKRGIWIAGRAIDQSSDRPVSAVIHYYPFLDNAVVGQYANFKANVLSANWSGNRFRTDDNGAFRVVGLPGHGLIAARSNAKNYRLGAGAEAIGGANPRGQFAAYNQPAAKRFNAFSEVNVPADAKEANVDVRLQAVETIGVRLVDSKGLEIRKVFVGGHMPQAGRIDGPFEGPTLRVATIAADDPRPAVGFLDMDRKIGVVLGREQFSPGAREMKVGLEPCATIRVRVVDSEGKPVRAPIEIQIPPSTPRQEELRLMTGQTDEQGRYETDLIPTGQPVVVDFRGINSTGRPSMAINPARLTTKAINPKPGEIIDLGTIDVTSNTRPEIVRIPRTAEPEVR